MTMTQGIWDTMNASERDEYRAQNDGYRYLSRQLIGLEGWRVEVETTYGETRRFIVSRSTGWAPCHIEVKTRRSLGGIACEREYKRVTPIRKVR